MANIKPILFNSDMVRAVLEGRKTQTRRVVKPQPKYRPFRIENIREDQKHVWFNEDRGYPKHSDKMFSKTWTCPYGKPGDRLWVRETFKYLDYPENTKVGYAASPDQTCRVGSFILIGNWRPSIHMPRWASRITLEITDVRVERVQSISGIDAIAEGIESVCGKGADVSDFSDLWDSINEKRGYGWEENPWVWVVEFKRIKTV